MIGATVAALALGVGAAVSYARGSRTHPQRLVWGALGLLAGGAMGWASATWVR